MTIRDLTTGRSGGSNYCPLLSISNPSPSGLLKCPPVSSWSICENELLVPLHHLSTVEALGDRGTRHRRRSRAYHPALSPRGQVLTSGREGRPARMEAGARRRRTRGLGESLAIPPFDIHEFSATTSGSSSNGSSGSKVPMMLAARHIEGNLEDAMLGIFDGDDLAWKVRAALLKDKFEQALILATIRAPTDYELFKFLGIKWFSIEYPPVVGSFIQKRDTLVIEPQGIATDENGEKYGYSLFHDFRHGTGSICTSHHSRFRVSLSSRSWACFEARSQCASSFVNQLRPVLRYTQGALSTVEGIYRRAWYRHHCNVYSFERQCS